LSTQINRLFGDHHTSRTAPVARTVADAMVIRSDAALAHKVQRRAFELLRQIHTADRVQAPGASLRSRRAHWWTWRTQRRPKRQRWPRSATRRG